MNMYSISELHFVTRYLWSQGCFKISVLQATFIYARHPPDNPSHYSHSPKLMHLLKL